MSEATEFAKGKIEKDNIFPKPTEGQEGLDILIKHFLGKDWYVVDPLPTKQVNTIAVYEILSLYEKRSLWGRIKNLFIKK